MKAKKIIRTIIWLVLLAFFVYIGLNTKIEMTYENNVLVARELKSFGKVIYKFE